MGKESRRSKLGVRKDVGDRATLARRVKRCLSVAGVSEVSDVDAGVRVASSRGSGPSVGGSSTLSGGFHVDDDDDVE